MTVAPIYLVSACASGEEFVAAFRRYADKNGLFVPIAQPFAIGRRGRFAVTLRDGGVMVEGEAEIVSSARTPSVLHGRVGMTLKFLEPDAASKTILGDLEKARLSMRPPPPSVAPRPAEVPAQPRPVPPAAQGRIDAVNALAECVAIGDAAQLDGLALAPPSASPPKAGPRFVVPTIAPAVAGAPAARPRTFTPSPMPAIAPRLKTPTGANRAIEPASTSDTMTAVAPPEPPPLAPPEPPPVPPLAPPEPPPLAPPEPPLAPPEPPPELALPRTGTRRGVPPAPVPSPSQLIPIIPTGPGSDTMTVPVPRAASPTDIGGALVDAAAAFEHTSPGAEPDAGIVVEAPAREDGSARTQVHAGIPPRDPSGPLRVPAQPAQLNPRSFANAPSALAAQSAPPDMMQTMRSPPPDMSEIRATIATRLGMQPQRETGAARPTPPSVGAAQPRAADVEIAEPTDLSTMPQQPAPRDTAVVDVPTEPEIRRVRKTAAGLAVTAMDAGIHGAAIGDLTLEDASLAAAEEATGADVIFDGNATIESADLPDGMIPASIDEPLPVDPAAAPPQAAAASDEPTPSEYWTIGAGGALAPSPKRPRTPSGGSRPTVAGAAPLPAPPAAAPASGATRADGSGPAKVPGPTKPPEPSAAPGAVLPSGDWLIALDPGAPDGWSAPFETVPAQQLVDEAPAPVPEPRAHRPMRPDAMPVIEPKVQIDPTLIEPLAAMPPEETFAPRTSSPNLPVYVTGGFASAPMPQTPYGQPSPFGAPQTFAGASAPAYPLDPSYQMVPISTPRAVTAGESGSGFADPRRALPASARRKRIIIVVASAIAAIVIGIVLLAVLTGKHEPAPPPPPVTPHAGAAIPLVPGPVSAAAQVSAAVSPAAQVSRDVPASPNAPASPASRADSAAEPAPAAATVTPVSAAPCYADVTSQPAGAEIVVGFSKVVGTTPLKIALPCGDKVELTIRKSHLVPATRTIMPTAAGAPVRVALARQMVQVKVSSLPMGATITLNGKPLGVTPTTIKLPALETSTLTIAKDGYATETQKIAPKASGVALHSTLKKLEHRTR